MKCPKCDSELRVTHTFGAGERAQTRDYKCTGCTHRFTSVTFLVGFTDEELSRRKGARTYARMVQEDRVRLEE